MSRGRGSAPPDAPTLVLVDSITLQEGNSSYVAEPGDIAFASNGTILIADRFAKKVHQFSRDGRFLGSLGRGGRGPGEFELPGFLALDGDSLLYAVDVTGVEIFNPRTASHLGAYPTDKMVGMLGVSGGTLFAGLADPAQNGSIAKVTGNNPRLSVTGPFPELLKDEALFPMFYPVALAVRGDTVATAYNVTNDVYLTTVAGRVLDSIPVPARRRNGVDADKLRRLAKNPTDQKLGEDAVYGTSIPLDLHWLPGGNIAVVFSDWRITEGRTVTANYLSVVDPRARHSCADALVPGPTDPPVRVGFRADTLFALAQEIGESSRMKTVIRLYRIDTDGCQWVTR